MRGTRTRRRRLGGVTRGEGIAAVAGVALIVATFLDWYSWRGDNENGLGTGPLDLISVWHVPANAWESLDVIPWLLLLVALVAIGAALLRLSGRAWKARIPLSAIVAIGGGVSTLLVLFRILFPSHLADIQGVPLRTSVELGAYLALAAAAGIAYGGYRAMGERGTSFAKVADDLSRDRDKEGKDAGRRPKRAHSGA